MRIEKFVLAVLIPMLAFLVWSMDARAEDAESYNYYGDFTANGQSYNCRFRISYTKNGYNHIYESWFNSDNGKFALVLGSPSENIITMYRMYNGELVKKTSSYGNVYKDVGYGTYRYKTTSATEYSVNVENNIKLPGYYSDVKDYVALAPIFDTTEHAKAYVQDGVKDGWLNEPPLDIENDGLLDEDIPIPKVDFIEELGRCSSFVLINASLEWNVEIKGRWLSVNDIQFYRDKGTHALIGTTWYKRYYATVAGDLSTWISANEAVNSVGKFELNTIASDSFSAFITEYPIEERIFREPDCSAFYKTFGYPGVLSELKALLAYQNCAYNAPEMYIRYWYESEDGIRYGRWTHCTYSLPKSDGSEGTWMVSDELKNGGYQSDRGLTTEEVNALEETGFSTRDTDLVADKPLTDWSDIDMASGMSSFSSTLRDMSSATSGVIGFVNSAFAWLPAWMIGLVALAIGAAVLLRFLGR